MLSRKRSEHGDQKAIRQIAGKRFSFDSLSVSHAKSTLVGIQLTLPFEDSVESLFEPLLRTYSLVYVLSRNSAHNLAKVNSKVTRRLPGLR